MSSGGGQVFIREWSATLQVLIWPECLSAFSELIRLSAAKGKRTTGLLPFSVFSCTDSHSTVPYDMILRCFHEEESNTWI
ncbi:unnamed protein product [Mycena citricolor]|uniref:Uncharacterized protein n=1 Tax=Mycena citricolor TaxID=2018698 RepID=A0AAD2GVV7_9AGAR|nr:unnamed protein product [Mycena citricolor]